MSLENNKRESQASLGSHYIVVPNYNFHFPFVNLQYLLLLLQVLLKATWFAVWTFSESNPLIRASFIKIGRHIDAIFKCKQLLIFNNTSTVPALWTVNIYIYSDAVNYDHCFSSCTNAVLLTYSDSFSKNVMTTRGGRWRPSDVLEMSF